jgi:hypothetical protein
MTIPTSNKECAIWNNKDMETHVMIFSIVSEEVRHDIVSINELYGSSNNLKDLYDSHEELELIQLLVNIFNLELNNDDPMALASKIKAIMHDIIIT